MSNNIIFQITEEDVQAAAMEKIGRKLTDAEMGVARKGIEWGLGDATLIMTYNSIFNEIIKGTN